MSAPTPVSGTREQRIAAVADRQRGMISRAQLRAIGISSSAVDRMAARGALHRVHRGVYRVGHRASPPWADETAALLGLPARAVLSHHSAAALWKLIPGPPEAIHVLVPGQQCGSPAGVIVHRTRTLRSPDHRVRDGLPVTSAARTLLDLADDSPDRELERAFDEALAARIVGLPQIREILARAAGRRGASRLHRLLGRASGARTITRSQAEERFLTLIREAGLPDPVSNVRLHGYEVDFYWPGERVVVEIDGFRWHGSRAAFERDRRKGAVLTAAGLMLIRATWEQIDAQPLSLVAAVAQSLGRGAA